MKNFKRVISMVLVLAMICGFAGMTGFTPGLIARAASNIVVQAPTTIYKAYGYSYSYSSGENTFTSPATDAVMPVAADCSLNSGSGITVTYPEGTEYFHGELSVDGERFFGIWGSVPRTLFPYGTSAAQITRDNPTISDYLPCDLYNSYLKGKGGYADYDTIYWRFRAYHSLADAEAKNYFDEIVVPIKLEFVPIAESSGVKISYATPNNDGTSSPRPPTSDPSSKPLDSLAGINQLTQFDVPSVLYRSGANIINNINSLVSTDDVKLDSTIDITFPSNVTSATLYLVGFGYYTDDDDIFKTIPLTITGGKATYDMVNAGTLHDEFVNGGYITYRLDYTCTVSHADANGNKYTDNTSVTYTQYAASVLKEVPQYKAIWQAGTRRHDCGHMYNHSDYPNVNGGYTFSTLNTMNFGSVLGVAGTNIRTSVRSDDGAFCTEDTYAFSGAIDFAGEHDGEFKNSDNYSIGFFWWPGAMKGSNKDERNFVGAQQQSNTKDSGEKDSYETVGGTVYYDKDLISSLSLGVTFAKTSVKGSSSYTAASIEGFYESWFTKSAYDGKEISGKTNGTTYTSGNEGWTEIGADGITDLNQIKYTNQSASSGGTVSGVSGNGTVAGTTTSATRTYTFTGLKDATSAKYLQLVTELTSSWFHRFKNAWGTSKEHTLYADQIFGWHVEFIPRDRSASRTLKNNAITYNYVKDEMDPTWWKNYRENVLCAYYNMGALEPEGNTFGITESYQQYPVYRGIDYSVLLSEIYASGVAPEYERGNALDNPESNYFQMGSKYAGKIDYRGTLKKDGSGATYDSANDGGNGIDNLTNSSLYRYSGAYFYNASRWEKYATLRNEAMSLINYPISVSGYLNSFHYGHSQSNFTSVANWEHETYGWLGSGLACYKQAEIDEMAIRLRAARQVLDNGFNYLTLADFKMRNDKDPSKDYDGDGVVDNVTAGNGAWVKDSSGKQIIGYDAIMAYLESLIPTETYTYYTVLADKNGNGAIDSATTTSINGRSYLAELTPVTEQVYDTSGLEALLSQMQSRFSADQTVVDMGLSFEEYIENFLAQVEITKRNPAKANTAVWDKIFEYISSDKISGDLSFDAEGNLVEITDENFAKQIERIYDLDASNFTTLRNKFSTAAAFGNDGVTTRNALYQDNINTAIENFFKALEALFPSKQVQNAGAEAKDKARKNAPTFEIYTPEVATNKTQSIYTPDSVTALETKVDEALGINNYQFSTTTWQSLADRYDEILSWATVKSATNTAGVLVNSNVNTDSMNTALDAAKAALTADKTSISVTSPDGKTTVTHDKYTAQSVAELEFVINQAETFNANQLYTNQLSVDMITFALYDECDDTTGLLLTSDTALAPRVWSYDANGNPTGYTDNWGAVIMKSMLYGARDKDADGTDEGLKHNTAYYGFLDKEVNFPADYTDTYETKVWNADGTLVMKTIETDNGTTTVPAGSTIYTPETWGAYYSAHDTAKNLERDHTTLKNDKYDGQKIVTDAANLVYTTRAALAYNFFPNNTEDFQAAKDMYTVLAAYLGTTPVTSYTVNADGSVKSTTENVYIYEGMTADIAAKIETFRTKYTLESSTESYDSLEKATELRDEILALITGDAATVPVLKAKDHADFTVGIQNLLDSFVAGTWNGTAFTSTLLNATQVSEINTRISNLYTEVINKADVTVGTGYGTSIASYTDQIFTYTTTTNAVNLQPIMYMWENEMEPLINYEVTINIPFYYGEGVEVKENIFTQDSIDIVVEGADEFFNDATKWPLIYQINGMTYEEEFDYDKEVPDAGWACKINGFVVDVETENADARYTAAAENGYSAEANTLITNLLNYFGAFSLTYNDLKGRSVVNDAYKWLSANAFVTDGTTTYVLAADEDGTNNPAAYDMSKANGAWYTEGYAVEYNNKKYYVYSSADGSWFVNTVDAKTATNPVTSNKSNYVELAGYDIIEDIFAVGNTYLDDFFGDIQKNQNQIDAKVRAYYEAIRALELRPATQAYRDVYELYLNSQKLDPVYTNEDDDEEYIAGDATDAAVAKFLNVSADFINRLSGNVTLYKANGEVALIIDRVAQKVYEKDGTTQVSATDKVDDTMLADYAVKYGEATEIPDYDTDSAEWAEVDTFLGEFTSTPMEYTIDMAAKVYDGPYAQLEALLAALPLVDIDFGILNRTLTAFFTNGAGANIQALSPDDKAALAHTGDNPATSEIETNFVVDLKNMTFVTAEMYTGASLKAAINAMYLANAISSEAKTELDAQIGDDGLVIEGGFNIQLLENYKGSVYQNATEYSEVLAAAQKVAAAFTMLQLRPLDITSLESKIEEAKKVVDEKAKYNFSHQTWIDFVAALEEYEYFVSDTAEEGNTAAHHTQFNVTHSTEVTNRVDDLNTKISALIPRGDAAAPEVNFYIDTNAIGTYYSDSKVAAADGCTNITTGTYYAPNTRGNSLFIYTNELNPRIILTAQDLDEMLDSTTTQEASKPEKITVSAAATRSSGTLTNVIWGTKTGDTINSAEKIAVTSAQTSIKNAVISGETYADSVYAILAPTFVNGVMSQAAKYSITIADSTSEKNYITADGSTRGDNFASKVNLGAGDVELDVDANVITIYVYYTNTAGYDTTDVTKAMANADNTGLTDDGTARKTITYSNQTTINVPAVTLDNEFTVSADAWRNSAMLTRSFHSGISAYEFVSPVDTSTGSPIYNDPNFGQKNTGSFWYILDKSGENALDKSVADAYKAAQASGSTDYAALQSAKQTMIDGINKLDDSAVAAMMSSDRFHEYGGYDVNGEYINYVQVMTKYVESGDLVFVHVLDRWGNVVNRLIEIKKIDTVAPALSGSVGIINVDEQGGSGLKDITLNGDFSSLGKVWTESGTQTLKHGDKEVTVTSTDNKISLENLIPNYGYTIKAMDHAGNINLAVVCATADGKLEFNFNNITEAEEGEVGPQMSSFTFNSTDVIYINSGESSAVLEASIDGNVLANTEIEHFVTTLDTVTALKSVMADGTVEEWTADHADVRVTNNGDGTLKWRIWRTFTEGEHSGKMYAKVGSDYEEISRQYTITATTKYVIIDYMVVGVGRAILTYSGSSPVKTSTVNSKMVAYGAKVKIEAAEIRDNCNFYYWINNGTDRIVSTADSMEFTAVTNYDYIAQFTSNATFLSGKKLVVYVNNAKNVIDTFEIAEGDNYTVPAAPALDDHNFTGWTMTKEEVLASELDTVVVEPIYTLTATNKVEITQGNYTVSGAGEYTAEDNARPVVTVTASATDNDGKAFLYWVDDETEEKVSYSRMYTFYCVKDIVLKPVYGDEAAVSAEPIVRVSDMRYNSINGKVTFYVERSIPDSYTVLQTGLVITKTQDIAQSDAAFVVGGVSTATGTSTSTANNGYYSASTAITTGATVWARGYAICETASGEIVEIYGPVASYTLN